MVDEHYLTVQQAGTRLQVGPETVRRMLRDGRLHGTRLGGTRAGWRIPSRQIEQLLDGATRPEEPALEAPSRPDVSVAMARAVAEVEACRAAGDDAGAARWEQIAGGIAASQG
jgi:excisionase family DNA binding protein